MHLIQEIGSYAGLAAVVGLAVLSALYFSQARDVKRLREWAGRAPERAPGSAPAQRAPAQTGAVRPVPRAPGQAVPSPAAGAAKPSYPPAPAGARAATGATPATAVGPAAATPAAARAAEAVQGGATQSPDKPPNGSPSVSQDTVVHPPPKTADDGDEPDRREEEESEEFDALADGDSGEVAAVEGDDDWDETGDQPAPEEHWEDTGDQPAVPPVPPRPAPPSIPSRPAPATPAASAARTPAPAAAGARTPGAGAILPPYARSRPGGDPEARIGPFASRGRAAAVAGIAVVAIAALAFGATQLIGGNDSSAPSGAASQGSGAQSSGSAGGKAGKKSAKGAINPSSVRVAVLNGTTVPGLAAQIGDSIQKQGFKLGTITNFNDQQRAESVVLFAPGAEREAAEVGRRLKISQREPIDAESQGVAGDATVVVVTGQDKTQ